MAKELSLVRGEVRNALNEISARFWSDAMLNTWINEGARDLSRRSECFLKVQSQAVSATVQDFNAPTDTIRIHRIEWDNLSGQLYPLQPRSLAEMDQLWGVQQVVTSGIPRFWVTRGSPPTLTVRLWPVPASSGNASVHYYRLSADVADGSNVDVPEGWYDLLVDYCEYRAKRRDNDPTWKDAKDFYESKLNDMIDVTRDYRDEAGFIVSPGGASVPSWLYGGGDW